MSNEILPQLVYSLSEQNRFYKQAAAFVLRAVAKHSPPLAQALEAGQSRGELPRRFVPSSLASAPYGSSSYGDDGSSVEQTRRLHMMAGAGSSP